MMRRSYKYNEATLYEDGSDSEPSMEEYINTHFNVVHRMPTAVYVSDLKKENFGAGRIQAPKMEKKVHFVELSKVDGEEKKKVGVYEEKGSNISSSIDEEAEGFIAQKHKKFEMCLNGTASRFVD